MDIYGNRYQLLEEWHPSRNGQMAKASDKTLKREVLLYRLDAGGEARKPEAVRWLGKAARLSDPRFLHILDMGTEGDELFAVLTSESGGPLQDRLRGLSWSGTELLGIVQQLMDGLREARRERLLDFPVTIDNLWLTEDGRLLYMNYWSDSEPERRGVRGLALLLYQLCALTPEPPASMDVFGEAVREAMGGLPGGTPDDAARWACSAFEPATTFAVFERGLQALLGEASPETARRVEEPVRKGGLGLAAFQPSSQRQTASDASQPSSQKAAERSVHEPTNQASHDYSHASSPKPTSRSPLSSVPTPLKPTPKHSMNGTPLKPPRQQGASNPPARLHPAFLFGALLLGVCVIIIWAVSRPHGTEAEPTAGNATPGKLTAAVTSSSPSSSASPRSSIGPTDTASAGATAKPTDSSQTASPSPSKTPTPPGNGKATNVPDLIGHTRAEAEKMALAAGLHYEYRIEANDAPAGTVFKQSLPAGKETAGGDKITFWVSKDK